MPTHRPPRAQLPPAELKPRGATPPNAETAFVCGAVSALMPTVVNLFQQYSPGGKPQPTNWLVFPLLALVYAVFAGLFTAWWEPETKFKAVWIGISFSTIVTELLQRVPKL